MPINYKRDYHPKWSLISRLIRHRRANNYCEECTVRNHAVIHRFAPGKFRYITGCELIELSHLMLEQGWPLWRALSYRGWTKVILSVSHQDRDRGNNRFSNLRALCQRCHLGYDMPQHVRNRQFGRDHDRPHQLTVFNS